MIETEDELLTTWRIMPSDFDMLLKGNEIQAVRIQDHDKKFLNYEGKLSKGNGSVIFFDRGYSKIIKRHYNTAKFILSGQIFKGVLNLILLKDDVYNIQYFAETANG